MAEAPSSSRRKKPKAKFEGSISDQNKSLKRKRHTTDIESLNAAVAALNPTTDTKLDQFSELPLSEATAAGLRGAHFTALTDIQRRAIPLALQGRDILGAAKTGSGKTLAFLIPVLENLVRKQWSQHDGLGALILSPTRELAIQIFQVLRKVGRYHAFSAGLVIGGKSLKEERERLGRMNILVCTPGRMLQHLDQTALFESTWLQMLVLDEADRILDMGFKSTVDAIIEHIPQDRQTLLFSATQTRRVSDLARLSLRNPEYVSVHESAAASTPSGLQQNYVVVPLPEKLDTLWGFLRSNVKKKILVFLSSGKQVRFAHESFRHLQPGIPLMHLHGRQKQGTRLDIVTKFSAAQNACLFSTDLAARGLDFPAVDWVVQLDCPEDADTYIHRVGRTARYGKAGNAVLFLEPSEAPAFLKRLTQKKVPIEEIRIRPQKQQSIKNQLQNMCFRDPELKYLGQKAFVSYARSVYTQHDKDVFNLEELPMEEYAASIGLPGTPRIKFQSGVDAKSLKNAPRMPASSDSEDGKASKKKTDAPRTRYDRMFERVNQDVLAPHYTNLLEGSTANGSGAGKDDDSEAEFLTVKRRLSDASSISSSPNITPPASPIQSVPTVALGPNTAPLRIDSKRREKIAKSKKALLKYKERGQKTVFDDDGNPHDVYAVRDEADFHAEGDAHLLREQFVQAETASLRDRDQVDKQMQRAKKRAKSEKRKARERGDDADGAGEASDEDMDGVPDLVELASVGEDENLGQDLDMLDWSDRGEPGDSTKSRLPAPTLRPTNQGKKPKKWFQSSSDDDEGTSHVSQNGGRGKGKGVTAGPQTLEELEALAEQYM